MMYRHLHGAWLDAGKLGQLMEWQRAGGSRLDNQRRTQYGAERDQRLRQGRRDVAAALPEPRGWSSREEPWMLEEGVGWAFSSFGASAAC